MKKKLKIKVLGGGYLGKKIAEYLDADLDTRMVYTVQDVQEMLFVHTDRDDKVYDVVINAIGKTGVPNVDWCEENQRETFMSNVLVPMHIAEAAKRMGVKMVHISSGCIYHGSKSDTIAGDGEPGDWTEEDEPNFDGSFYSFTKKTAERAIAQYENVLTLRVRMPISGDRGPRNLITKLLGYEKITKGYNSVTPVKEFLKALKVLIDSDAKGIYNVVSPHEVTHEDILALYDEVMGTDEVADKQFVWPSDLELKAPRSDTVLDTTKLCALVEMLPTLDAIRSELEDYKNAPEEFIPTEVVDTEPESAIMDEQPHEEAVKET